MKDKKTAKITASDTWGEEHEYVFKLLDTATGLRFVYRYAGLLAVAKDIWKEHIIPLALAVFKGEDAAGDAMAKAFDAHGIDSLADALALIPMVFSEDRIMEYGQAVLAGATIDGAVVDKDGMCEIFKGDPLAHISAIFWATAANFPKYLDPLLEMFSEAGDAESDVGSTPELPTEKIVTA